MAGINYKPKLVNFDSNVDKYDEVIIGSPIWNGRISCPINSALDKLNLDEKNVTFILYSGGEAPKAYDYLKKRYSNSKIIILKEPRSDIEGMKKVLSSNNI